MRKNLIVFIHGLGGDGQETWGGFPSLIRDDPELRSYEIAFYEYTTSLFRLPFSKKCPRIQTLADALRTLLRNRYPSHRPIILVAHSLGGLVARQFIAEEISANRPLRIQKLLLYAVPVNGAGLAEVGRHVSWRHRQLEQLCRNSDLIDNLNRQWQNLGIADLVHTLNVVAGQDRVVDEMSARGFAGNPRVEVLIDRNHRNCVKPTKSDDLSFLILKKFVLDPWTSSPRSSGQPIIYNSEATQPKGDLQPRVLVESAKVEGNRLRVLFTIWNPLEHAIRVFEIATEQLQYKSALDFLSGERTQLELRGNESTLWQGQTHALEAGSSESFDLTYSIQGREDSSKPTVVLAIRASFHSAGSDLQQCRSESLFIYDSLRERVSVLRNEDEVFGEVGQFPFFAHNVKLWYDYVDYRRDCRAHLIDRMLTLYARTFEKIQAAARSEGRFTDEDRAKELWESISSSYDQSSCAWSLEREDDLDWDKLRGFRDHSLRKAHSLHLKYFGDHKPQIDRIRSAVFELWDPLGIKDIQPRIEEYDDCVLGLYRREHLKCAKI